MYKHSPKCALVILCICSMIQWYLVRFRLKLSTKRIKLSPCHSVYIYWYVWVYKFCVLVFIWNVKGKWVSSYSLFLWILHRNFIYMYIYVDIRPTILHDVSVMSQTQTRRRNNRKSFKTLSESERFSFLFFSFRLLQLFDYVCNVHVSVWIDVYIGQNSWLDYNQMYIQCVVDCFTVKIS